MLQKRTNVNTPPNGDRMENPPDVTSTRTNDSSNSLYQVPLVRIREDADGGLRLVETGTSEWVPESFIRRKYGVAPELLRDFRISGDSMVDTIRPGDRVRAVLWDCRAPNDGTICIIRGPISLHVRRIRFEDSTVLLIADNPEVPNQDIELEEWQEHYEPIARMLEVRRAL